MLAAVTIFATLLSFCVYAWAGLSGRSRAENEKQYFIADQQVSESDYANISVGYALQMAALFLFTYWGFVYGIGAVWTAIFWGLGYIVLYRIIPRFLDYRRSADTHTIHSYIRFKYSSSQGLQIVAASATIIGLLGVMFAEVDYTTAIYKPILNQYIVSENSILYLQVLFLILGLSYIIWNGYKAEVNAERIQVPLAYIGLLAVLLAALPQVYVNAGERSFTIICFATAVALMVMALGKLYDIAEQQHLRRLKWLNWQAVIPLTALLVLACEYMATRLYLVPGAARSVLDQPITTQLLAQGGVGLISLLLANSLWMPVDVSTWQRVGSVKGSDADALLALRRGTFRVMLESPASWCLAAILGWTISAGGYVSEGYSDPYSVIVAFAEKIHAGHLSALLGEWQVAFYPLFVVSCVAIMSSTITSVLSAVSLTVDRDLMPDHEDNVPRVRALSAFLLIVGFFVYEGLRRVFDANLPTILYGAYSAQLALLIVSLLALYGRRLNARAAFWSIIVGLLCALVSTAIAVLRPQVSELSVLPPMFAIVGALIAYIFMYEISEDHEKR